MASLYELRRALRRLSPFIVLLASVLLMILPLRLDLLGVEVPMPMLPMVVVFLYAVYDPDTLSSYAVFGLGLVQDILYGGAFGVWASVYLALQYLVHTQRDYFRGRVPHVIWLAFGLALLIVAPLLWAERSLIAGQFLTPWPMVIQFAYTLAVYPLLSRLFFMLRERVLAQEALL